MHLTKIARNVRPRTVLLPPAPALPTCSQLRAQLKKAHGVDAGSVECVYSSEEQVAEMLPLSKEQKKNPEEFGVVDNVRCSAKQEGASSARWSARFNLVVSSQLSVDSLEAF